MSTDPSGLELVPERAFPSRAGPAERLRFLLSYAVLAPSRHNSQPWLFEIEGDELRVHADTARALPEADPDGRELFMACGAALVNLRLAAAHFGHATTAESVPEHRRDGLVARVWLEERRATTPESEELFQAIPRRRTNRLPLDGREPPDGLLTRLLREAREEGAWLRRIEEPQRRAVAELIAEGDARQWASARFRAEVAAWARRNGGAARDGMPGYVAGLSDAAALLYPVRLRLSSPARDEAERDRRRALGSKALLVLSTRRDGKVDWLAAGEALQRILLRAAAAGLSASYFNQPIECAGLRDRLREASGAPGLPQVMLRLGYGLGVRGPPRRPVDEVLRGVQGAEHRAAPIAIWSPPAEPAWKTPAVGAARAAPATAPPP